jgi:hypothetical protein
MDNFSYLAVLVGAMAFYFLGFVWYTFMFRKPWMADMGIDPATPPQAPGPGPLVGSFAAALVLAGAIEFIVRDAGIGFGACRGTIVGIAIAAVIGQNALYDTRPKRLWVINSGYALVGAAVVGIISGAL